MYEFFDDDLMYLCDFIDSKFVEIYDVKDNEKKYLMHLSEKDLIIERDRCAARLKTIEEDKLRYYINKRGTRSYSLQRYFDELKKMELICKIATFKWEAMEYYHRHTWSYNYKQFYQECELILYLIETNRYISYLGIIFYFERMRALYAIEYLLNLKIIKVERNPKKTYEYYWVINEENRRKFEESGEDI